MILVNTEDFKGKRDIRFNGSPIEESQKGTVRITATTSISVSTPDYKYTCVPSVHKKQ